MIISPIYEDRRSIIEAKELKSGMTFSIIICFVLILLPFFIAEGISEAGAGYGFYIILSWLIAPFVGFGNLIGKLQKRNARENFNREYEEIFNKYKEIAKKKSKR